MTTPSAFSKHVQLIKKCYPALPEEKGPRSSDLAYLVFYATSRPEKLVKVGAFLEKQTRSDLYHLHFDHAEVTLKILDTLIRECHKDVSLFLGNILSILSQSLAIEKQPSLTRTTTQTFIRFCQCPDAHAAMALDHHLSSTFIHLLDQYATYAKIPLRLPLDSPAEDQDPEMTLRICGVKAMVATTLASLSAPDSRSLLRRGIPALLANILPAQLHETTGGKEGLTHHEGTAWGEGDFSSMGISLDLNFPPGSSSPPSGTTEGGGTTASSSSSSSSSSTDHPVEDTHSSFEEKEGEGHEGPVEEKNITSHPPNSLDPDAPLLQDPYYVLVPPLAIEYLSVLSTNTFARTLTQSSTVGVKLTVLNAFRSMNEGKKEDQTYSSTSSQLLALMLRSTRPANRFIVVTEILSQLKLSSPFPFIPSSGSKIDDTEKEGERRTGTPSVAPITLLSSLGYLLQRGYSYAGISVLELTDALRPWLLPLPSTPDGGKACAQVAKACLLLLGTQRTYMAQGAEVLSRLLSGISPLDLQVKGPVSSSPSSSFSLSEIHEQSLSLLSMAQEVLQHRRDGVGARVMEEVIIPLLSPSIPSPLRLAALELLGTLVAPTSSVTPATTLSSSLDLPSITKGVHGSQGGNGLQKAGEPDLGPRDVSFRSKVYARLIHLCLLDKEKDGLMDEEYSGIWRVLASFLLRFHEEALVEGFPWVHHLFLPSLEDKDPQVIALVVGWIHLAGRECGIKEWVRITSVLLKEKGEYGESVQFDNEEDTPSFPFSFPALSVPPGDLSSWTATWLVDQAFNSPSATPPDWSSRFINLPSLLLIPPPSFESQGAGAHPSSTFFSEGSSGSSSMGPREEGEGDATPRARSGRTRGSPGSTGIGIRSSRNFESLISSSPASSHRSTLQGQDLGEEEEEEEGHDEGDGGVARLREALAAQVISNSSIGEMGQGQGGGTGTNGAESRGGLSGCGDEDLGAEGLWAPPTLIHPSGSRAEEQTSRTSQVDDILNTITSKGEPSERPASSLVLPPSTFG
ncbi:MAG: hypothetical protein DHS80DRAFT_32409 [Piptocephalis tieghemiana]|nr:MAG: hypothetical protein DHS80DRAFT_32409 [Piptocephalis tieghemiana]